MLLPERLYHPSVAGTLLKRPATRLFARRTEHLNFYFVSRDTRSHDESKLGQKKLARVSSRFLKLLTFPLSQPAGPFLNPFPRAPNLAVGLEAKSRQVWQPLEEAAVEEQGEPRYPGGACSFRDLSRTSARTKKHRGQAKNGAPPLRLANECYKRYNPCFSFEVFSTIFSTSATFRLVCTPAQ